MRLQEVISVWVVADKRFSVGGLLTAFLLQGEAFFQKTTPATNGGAEGNGRSWQGVVFESSETIRPIDGIGRLGGRYDY